MTERYLHEVVPPKYVKHETPVVARLVAKHHIERPEDSEPFLLQASARLRSSNWVFIDKTNRNIKVYNEGFKFFSMFCFNTQPFDVCASNRSKYEFYVTEPEARMVHCFSIEFGQLKVIRSIFVDEECRGVTCWKKGLALSVMRDGFKGTLGILDYNGKIKRKCWESKDHDQLFRAPWYLSANNAGTHVIVSDQGNHTVTCLHTKTLDVIFQCSSHHVMNPRSVTVDGIRNTSAISRNNLGGNMGRK